MHRRKAVNILAVLQPPDKEHLSDLALDSDIRSSGQLSGALNTLSTHYAELEDAALQAERKNNLVRAAALMLEALQSRQQTAADLLGAPGTSLMETCAHYCQVIYAWAFHFVREGVLERAFELLRTLTQVTSHKSGLRFKGKKRLRHRCFELYVWYYSRISKHSAAYDYIQSCRKRPTVSIRDTAVLALLEGFVLSNLERSKEAVRCHHEAREVLESREVVEMEERTMRVCQAVAFYNLAADYCNVFQQKDAAPYIRQAGQIANEYLSEGMQLREKINSLYEELLGSANSHAFQLPFKGSESDKVVEVIPESHSTSPIRERRANSRPPIQRRPDKEPRIKAINGPFYRKTRKSPITNRWRPVNMGEGHQPTSSSIGPNSPTASKSSSANPHRRKRMLKTNIDYGYKEAENLLRKRMESMQSYDNRKEELQEPHSHDYRQMLSGWKERHSREIYPAGLLVKALKINLARRRCRVIESRMWIEGIAWELWTQKAVKGLKQALKSAAEQRKAVKGLKYASAGLKCYMARRAIHRTEASYIVLKTMITRSVLHSLSVHLTDFSKIKRHEAAFYSLKQLIHNYTALVNLEALLIAQRLKSLTFHKRRPSVEIRNPTPDLSVIYAPNGRGNALKPPLFSALWIFQALAAVQLYEKLHRSDLASGLKTWRGNALAISRAKSAVKLQSFRRMLNRKTAYCKLIAAVTLLQRQIRAWSLKRRTAAAISIQRIYLSHYQRRKITKSHAAATCIQRHYRGYVSRKRLRRESNAVRRIQRAVRRLYRFPYLLRA
jgi:hypothetical protein